MSDARDNAETISSEGERLRYDFELKKLDIALAERRLDIEDKNQSRKGSSEIKTGLISIVTAIVAALATYAAAYYGGFFDVQKANIASKAPLNLTKLQFSNDLVKTALSSKNPANSLMFYADVGLLEGLKQESIKDYAEKENERVASGGQGPSLLPSISPLPTFPMAPTPRGTLRLSSQLIIDVAPNAQQSVVTALTSIGNYILTGFEINKNPKRLAAFLGHLLSESNGFTATNVKGYAHNPEKTANRLYAGRLGNGPESSGDGWKFRGRGFLTITGRANYEKLSKQTGINLLQNPDLAADPYVAVLLAATYWHNNKLNAVADISSPDEFAKAMKLNFSDRFGSDSAKEYSSDSAKEYTIKLTNMFAKSRGIMILEGANGTVDFLPDVPGARLGQPLGVRQGDDVTWNNRTNRALVLESIPPGTYLTEEIPAGLASDPSFPVTQTPGTRITYSCKNPPQQQHSIVVK